MPTLRLSERLAHLGPTGALFRTGLKGCVFAARMTLLRVLEMQEVRKLAR
jgi:hypothetical protein